MTELQESLHTATHRKRVRESDTHDISKCVEYFFFLSFFFFLNNFIFLLASRSGKNRRDRREGVSRTFQKTGTLPEGDVKPGTVVEQKRTKTIFIFISFFSSSIGRFQRSDLLLVMDGHITMSGFGSGRIIWLVPPVSRFPLHGGRPAGNFFVIPNSSLTKRSARFSSLFVRLDDERMTLLFPL